MTVSPLQIIHFQVPERHGSPMTMGSHAEAATVHIWHIRKALMTLHSCPFSECNTITLMVKEISLQCLHVRHGNRSPRETRQRSSASSSHRLRVPWSVGTMAASDLIDITQMQHTMINPSDTQGPSTRDPTAHHIPINPPR